MAFDHVAPKGAIHISVETTKRAPGTRVPGNARTAAVQVDPLQADVGATRWVAPISLSAPPTPFRGPGRTAGIPPGSRLGTCHSVGRAPGTGWARSGELATTWSVIAKTEGNYSRPVP